MRWGGGPDGFFVLDPDTDPPVAVFRAVRFGQRSGAAPGPVAADAYREVAEYRGQICALGALRGTQVQ